ncbi:MAG: nucleoside deaminase [Saprospirales bacterium]|nr:MAG: nucleoside deaminase [Saprospirales bacterium]
MTKLSVFSDEYFMKKAWNQAKMAAQKGEVPVGAVITMDNQIIAQTHNQVEQLNDVTAHAEILAITAAAEHIGTKYLWDCTLYVTLEPCIMCAGAISWAQIGKLVFSAQDDKRGFMRVGRNLLHDRTKLAYGVMEQESSELIKTFFARLR